MKIQSSIIKDVIVFLIAFVVFGTIFYFVLKHDEKVMGVWDRNAHEMEKYSIPLTESELRVAKQFGDSTLPELTARGFIKAYHRTEVETLITVSGTMWKERSRFFKESFLTQIILYNKLNNFPASVKIIDNETGTLCAQVVEPDMQIIYD